MKIAILGAGNGGCALAADLTLKGLDITLIKTSNALHDDNYDYIVKNHGKITFVDYQTEGNMDPNSNMTEKVCHISHVTRDVSAVKDAEIIIVFVQTKYHESVIEKIKPYIQDGQILMLMPGYFSTAYVLKHLGDKKITVVETQSAFIDGRIAEPGRFKVWFRNVRNPLGVFPNKDTEMVREKLVKFKIPFTYLNHVAEAALHNPNLIVHTVGALMSVPQIENMKENFCLYRYGFTPHVWNVVERLDQEKMDVLEKIGCERLKYVDACKLRNTIDLTQDGKKIFFDYAAVLNGASGPYVVESRYITEDVPEGLVMLESLGKHLGVETPTTSALIDLANAVIGRDFRNEGRTLDRLSSDNVSSILRNN